MNAFYANCGGALTRVGGGLIALRLRYGTDPDGSWFVCTMPRYFFDVHDGAVFTADEIGVELDGIEAARQEAGSALEGFARDLLRDGQPHEVVIEVKDEGGQRLLVAKLSATYEHTELPGFSMVE